MTPSLHPLNGISFKNPNNDLLYHVVAQLPKAAVAIGLYPEGCCASVLRIDWRPQTPGDSAKVEMVNTPVSNMFNVAAEMASAIAVLPNGHHPFNAKDNFHYAWQGIHFPAFHPWEVDGSSSPYVCVLRTLNCCVARRKTELASSVTRIRVCNVPNSLAQKNFAQASSNGLVAGIWETVAMSHLARTGTGYKGLKAAIAHGLITLLEIEGAAK